MPNAMTLAIAYSDTIAANAAKSTATAPDAIREKRSAATAARAIAHAPITNTTSR